MGDQTTNPAAAIPAPATSVNSPTPYKRGNEAVFSAPELGAEVLLLWGGDVADEDSGGGGDDELLDSPPVEVEDDGGGGVCVSEDAVAAASVVSVTVVDEAGAGAEDVSIRMLVGTDSVAVRSPVALVDASSVAERAASDDRALAVADASSRAEEASAEAFDEAADPASEGLPATTAAPAVDSAPLAVPLPAAWVSFGEAVSGEVAGCEPATFEATALSS